MGRGKAIPKMSQATINPSTVLNRVTIKNTITGAPPMRLSSLAENSNTVLGMPPRQFKNLRGCFEIANLRRRLTICATEIGAILDLTNSL